MLSVVLLEAFAELPDPCAENRRYPLPHLIFIAITIVLSSADDWEMVEELAKTKVAWLKKFIPLPHGIPSHDTVAVFLPVLILRLFRQRLLPGLPR